MPVHNGVQTLDRAILSVLHQVFPSWELIIVDDGSTDGTYQRLLHWSLEDERIRVFKIEENRGPSAARNEALRKASGKLVSYLDCDDEYYPRFLGKAVDIHDKADVLIFGYDYIFDAEIPTEVHTWDPSRYRDLFFARNLSTPLGVVHRRDLSERVGGFDESLWCQEDWDFWKRLARAGAEFLFVSLRSGLYHLREGSLSHTPRLAEHQRDLYDRNRSVGETLYGSGSQPAVRRTVRSALLVTSDAYVDSSHPLGVAASALMELLSLIGFACQAFGRVLAEEDVGYSVERILEHGGLPRQSGDSLCGHFAATVTHTRMSCVPVTLVKPLATGAGDPSEEADSALFAFFEKFLDKNRPDVLLADSPIPDRDLLIKLAIRRDIPVIVPLLDVPHPDRLAFYNVDYCVVNTEEARRRFWRELGLACVVLPPAIDWKRTYVERRDARFLTFIATAAGLGLLVFARIVERLACRRPDIPVLVVADRTRSPWYARTGLDLGWAKNVHMMDLVRHPRDYYGVTKVLVSPWAGDSPLAFSAAEAMISGIPVVGSNLGSLPELVQDAGYLLDIPVGEWRSTARAPEAGDVEHWVETIARLWDDSTHYEELSLRARANASRWHPDITGPLYAEFLRNVHPQPGPPFVPLPMGR